MPSDGYPLEPEPLPKPKRLEEMIEMAAKLSEPFPQVRVDLYNIDGKVYFGELTFTALGGMMNYYSDEFQCEVGQMIEI